MKIKAILTPIASERDRSGNVYWAFRYTDTESGHSFGGLFSGGESNIAAVVSLLDLDWEEVYYLILNHSKSHWKRLTQNFDYAGCAPHEIAGFINRKLEDAKAKA